ncbi:MAG TPA: ATP-binding protein [Chitinophagaceae bacterium]|nr:ATP-binding protein [Chitinophagaceae bacterium]
MPAAETKIFDALLIAVAIVAIFVLFFIATIISYQRKHHTLYLQKIAAEIDTLENERKHIAADLHDDLGPMLSLLKIQMTGVFPEGSDEQQIFEDAGRGLDYALHIIRNLNNSLLPHTLVENGLYSSLEEYIQQINTTGALYAEAVFTEDELPLKMEEEITIYRIIREIVTNTLKHAEANRLVIIFRKSKKHFTVEITDDGKGFDKYEVASAGSGTGLKNIMSRVELLNGDLFLESMPGKGVRYEIRIPITYD